MCCSNSFRNQQAFKFQCTFTLFKYINIDLLRSAYEKDKTLKYENCPSWERSVGQLKTLFNLNTLDISHVEFTKEMHNYYSNKIMNQLTHIRNNETGKLRFYSKIVSNFVMQTYLTFNINKYLRSNLTKLRLSAHSLAIETGRYCKPIIPANERFCFSCKNKVEDECHFLIECPLYDILRDKFFTIFDKNSNKPSMEQVNRLLNPNTSEELKNTCSYLKESLHLRDTVFKNS